MLCTELRAPPSPGFSVHSYLGLGLMSARLAVLGGEEGKPGEWGSVFSAPGARAPALVRHLVASKETLVKWFLNH